MAAHVTLEVLAEKLDGLIRSNNKEHKELLKDIGTLNGKVDLMNGRQRNDHDAITALRSDLNVRTGLLAGLQVFLSTVAAYLGIKQ